MRSAARILAEKREDAALRGYRLHVRRRCGDEHAQGVPVVGVVSVFHALSRPGGEARVVVELLQTKSKPGPQRGFRVAYNPECLSDQNESDEPHPDFENSRKDDEPSKNEPKRVEHEWDIMKAPKVRKTAPFAAQVEATGSAGRTCSTLAMRP